MFRWAVLDILVVRSRWRIQVTLRSSSICGDALYLHIIIKNRKTINSRLSWKLITDLKFTKIVFVTLDNSRGYPDFKTSFQRDLCKAAHELSLKNSKYRILRLQLVSFAQEYPQRVSLIFQFVLRRNELVGLRLHESRSRLALNCSSKDELIWIVPYSDFWR